MKKFTAFVVFLFCACFIFSFEWKLKDNGTLFINGSGDMPDFSDDTVPWNNLISGCTNLKNFLKNLKRFVAMLFLVVRKLGLLLFQIRFL